MTLTPQQITERPSCACGCGQPVGIATHDDRGNGYVKGQFFTYRRGHSPRASGPAYVVTDAGCWEWQRSRGRDGYGRLSRLGIRYLAHRYFYEQAKGSVPDGMQLDHLCRNPSCVNPDHLEPVTNAENARRGRQAKLTMDDVRAIRESTDDARLVARRYGIARSTVYGIRGRQGWRDV